MDLDGLLIKLRLQRDFVLAAVDNHLFVTPDMQQYCVFCGMEIKIDDRKQEHGHAHDCAYANYINGMLALGFINGKIELGGE